MSFKPTPSAWQSFLTCIESIVDMGKKYKNRHRQEQPQAPQKPPEFSPLSGAKSVMDTLKITDMLVVPVDYVLNGPVEEEIEARGMVIRMENLHQVGVVRALGGYHYCRN